MVKFKAIKPGPFYDDRMLQVLRERMQELGAFIIQDFDRVTEGWKAERPVWTQVYRAGANWMQLSIEPADPGSEGAKKWAWLDQGTPAHTISPKPDNPRGLLFFLPGYQAGSSPGSLLTTSSSSSGMLVAAKVVQHPGIEPRGWTDLLKEEWTRNFEVWAQDAMRQAASASGHGRE